jgi:hypothetical protein
MLEFLKNKKIYPVKLNFYFTGTILILIIFFSFFGVVENSQSATLIDFEDGLYSSSGGHFRYYMEGDSELTLDTTQGMGGTNQSLHVNTLLNNFHVWYIQNDEHRDLIPEGYGTDRMSFYVELPNNYPSANDYNFHVGTYTRDPEITSTDLGHHYYHLFNITGSDYPIKFIINQHPQHLSGASGLTIEDNPDEWNYFDGFTRFYLSCEPWDDPPISNPFVSYLDEVQFYSVTEPENDETINSISCNYIGEGNFIIGWHGNSQYDPNYHDYQVKYSTSPITNDNYEEATDLPGNPTFTMEIASGVYNYIEADFTIPVTENQPYYFAIKDLDLATNYVSKIDYTVYPLTSDTTPPSAPSGLGVN